MNIKKFLKKDMTQNESTELEMILAWQEKENETYKHYKFENEIFKVLFNDFADSDRILKRQTKEMRQVIEACEDRSFRAQNWIKKNPKTNKELNSSRSI